MDILIVDDSPTMRRILTTTLAMCGYKEGIREAENGRKALEVLHDYTIDLILTDWNMPEMDGPEFVRKLKQNDHLKHIPILMITHDPSGSDVQEAMELKVNGILVKPFTPEDLREKIKAVI